MDFISYYSGVNTPIPKMKIAYKEPTALASLIQWHWTEVSNSKEFTKRSNYNFKYKEEK